jgi:hypothetical protein
MNTDKNQAGFLRLGLYLCVPMKSGPVVKKP